MNKRVICSFSGGKDSTAMLLRAIEEGIRIDEVVMFDTGWEFPQMIEHVQRVQDYIDMEITILHSRRDFEYWMLERPIKSRKDRPECGIKKGDVFRIGNGWPSPMRRWCTREKVEAIDRYCGDATRLIGFAMDEAHRTEKIVLNSKKYQKRYPLIEWGMDEAACLKYCYDRGFDWGGLYNHFRRVSCFCCPLQRLGELRTLRLHFPDLWQKMLDWEDRIGVHNRGFRNYTSVCELDQRFAWEDRQQEFDFVVLEGGAL